MAQDLDANDALAIHLRAAAAAPENEEVWDQLEAVVRTTRKVDEVTALYRAELARPHRRDVALRLLRRAIAFQDEWGEDPSGIRGLLERVLELDPTANWAFDRISLELTTTGRWDELLGLYDSIIERTANPERRAALLEEAAHVAKNSAGKPERAVDYLASVFALKPADSMVAGALERLLRQQKRFSELIDFWTVRLAVLDGEEGLATQEQIAICWLENLNDPVAALAAVEPLLADASTTEAACKMLEQVLVSPASNAQARAQALARLSERWDASDRWQDLVRALRVALVQLEGEERIRLHKEIAQRYLAHGQLAAAVEDLAALVAADTKDWSAQDLDDLLAGSRQKPLLGQAVTLDADYGRKLVSLAAQIAQERQNDPERAMQLLGRLVRDRPEDLESIKRLGALFEQTGRWEDLLRLRKHELSIADSPRMRLYLRLDIAKLLREQGDTAGGVQVLRDNLAEQPRHDASVRALIKGLEELNSYSELVDFLWAQAEATEASQANATSSPPGTSVAPPGMAAAELWNKAAELAETQLHDRDRALAAYRRVVLLREDPGVLEALARLHSARGEFAAAIDWLVRRLAVSEPGSRAETIIELATAYRAAGRHEDAAQALREGLEEDPTHLEMRQLLAELYRRSGEWEALAAVLQEGAELMHEETKRFELLSEAADIFVNHLATPERAISVLENARAIAPGDRVIRTRLADALRAAGRLGEAHRLAQELMEELGRRRVPERALLHRLLAQIAEASGNMEEALHELELAASVDVSNAQVQRMLGAAYSKVGQLEKAERAYQALLLILRRQRGQARSAESPTGIGIAEALFEIHRVALELGDQSRAREALESAFDAAAESDAEARWLERILRTDGTPELLMRALRQRLSTVTDPAIRGEILAEEAGVLEQQLREPNQALNALLQAVAELPRSEELHRRSLELGRKLGALESYREVLAHTIRQVSDAEDWPLACDLLLRSGQIAEQEVCNLDHAADLYARAESTGQRRPEVWRAIARVAAARGDKTGELSALRNMAEIPGGTLAGEERVEILYRLAELELGFPDSVYSGLETLKQALRTAPQLERAAEALRKALTLTPQDEVLVDLYEQVARDAWNDDLLLDALQRRAELSGATQALLEEAYQIAARLERGDRAEAILLRAVEVARDEVADLSLALWALRLLIANRLKTEQLDDAVHWMREAADVAPPEESRKLRMEIAAVAGGPLNRFDLAADTYEALLDDCPGDPVVWKPALEVVRRMGDKDRFERLLTRVAEAVTDPHARNQLRVAKARLLLTLPGRQDDAIVALEQVLEEDLEHAVAAELLAEQLERCGRIPELINLLERQIDLACEKGSAEIGVKLTLRLGQLLMGPWAPNGLASHLPVAGVTGEGSENEQEAAEEELPVDSVARDHRNDAAAAYRALLEWVPDDAKVTEALYSLLEPDRDGQERADVLERLVLHLERSEADKASGRALTLALELVRLRDRLGDPVGMERALEQAFRVDAHNPQILDELRRLAQRLHDDAGKAEPDTAVELLQKSAGIYWNRLDDPTVAAEILTQAHNLQPTQVGLVSKLVRCLVEIGRSGDAIGILTRALEGHQGRDPQRIRLLRLRASIHSGAGEQAAATGDLEEAISLGAEGLTEELRQALVLAKTRAHEDKDREAERDYTLRLTNLLTGPLGDESEARHVLTAWLAQNPLDREAIQRLIALDSAARRWTEVAASCARLVRLEEGEAQTDAALALGDAYEKAGTPEAARDILESLYKLEPGDTRLRGRLRRLYERIEAFRDLSNLLLVDANHATDDDLRFNLLKDAGEIRLHKLHAATAAIGPLSEAHDLRPKDLELTLLLADAYVDAGFADDATQLLQATLERQGERRTKDLSALQHRMARAVAASDDPSRELVWLISAWESNPQNGDLASELAERAMVLGDHEVALKALRALAAMRTPAPISRPMALLKQARIARLQGDERKAVFLAKKAASEDSGLAEAQAFLQELQV